MFFHKIIEWVAIYIWKKQPISHQIAIGLRFEVYFHLVAYLLLFDDYQ